MKIWTPVLALTLSFGLTACDDDDTEVVEISPQFSSAQLVGTLHDYRDRWNPFSEQNNMTRVHASGDLFTATYSLSPTGGRAGDGVYAIRFFTDHELSQVYKHELTAPGHLLTGEQQALGNNIVFQVSELADYTISFDPVGQTFTISPEVALITEISSMQVNGFAYPNEGSEERVIDGRTMPAEVWDETRNEHNMTANGDGTFSKTMPLTVDGGHEGNGVYQILFSANHIADFAFAAVNNRPGELSGGNGYNSKVGLVEEASLVFQVEHDSDYTITVDPASATYHIDPSVAVFNDGIVSYQVNGSAVSNPWDPTDDAHQMQQEDDGSWSLTVPLATDGGDASNGSYVINFSANKSWSLDSTGAGGVWGKALHALPQESNILFKVNETGDHTIRLWPDSNRFEITPEVTPLLTVASLRLVGSMSEWNANDPSFNMSTPDGKYFYIDIDLTAGDEHWYKYTANDAAWGMVFADYNYDGYRELSLHGDPAAFNMQVETDGTYRFWANVDSGDYGITLLN
ncbi:hypothetical protein EZV61_07335 [Corallincola luteus]|uniref:Uncharacterized protein n=1 Tax=Corallincola luteus TaxID=1775177 RepID=A0ABY2APH2_9GAMM|nr:hypothetical protein [Corallincola luteus]TCI03999.1 hypothetical protein EZV61_07335 [Corallincola luteus]